MMALAAPAGASIATAGLSLLFYVGFARLYGDAMLGVIILTLSSVALIQIALVPQAWVYVVGAPDPGDIGRRYSGGVVVETLGSLAAIAVLGIAVLLPLAWLDGHRAAALWQLAALCIAGATSVQGLLRARLEWRRYFAWVVLPSALRVVMIGAALLMPGGLLARLRGDQAALTIVFFLAPELVRLAAVNLPVLLADFRPPPLAGLAADARRIFANWQFDIGSAVTEVADRVVVGRLLGPELLVVYFFARKAGNAVTMLVEPLYAERYRRAAAGHRVERTLALGAATALAVVVLLLAGVAVVALVPPLARLVPQAVADNLWLFAGLMAIDGLIAANRWSRFLTQLGGRAGRLLAVRLILFGAFTLTLVALSGLSGGLGLLIAFAGFWLLETLFVTLGLRRR